MAELIRTLIVDDHAIVREGLRALLETNERMEVVGEAENGRQAIQLAGELSPDVVLMDPRMPEMDGVSATYEILRRRPGQPIIILTTYNEDDLIVSSLRAGAGGYIPKDMNRHVLFRSIEAAVRGEALLSPDILATALRGVGPTPRGERRPAGPSPLTDREHEVLSTIAVGLTSKATAESLAISERTVKAHLTHIYDKFGVDTRAAEIAFAAERGWLS